MSKKKEGPPAKVGRPPTYRAEFCEAVIQYGKEGKSFAWIATELGVTRKTLYVWMEDRPEFGDAMTRARDEAQRWWEDAGQSGMVTPGFNASVWSRSMAARFPEDWREKSEQSVTLTKRKATELTDDELAAIAAGRGGGTPEAP